MTDTKRVGKTVDEEAKRIGRIIESRYNELNLSQAEVARRVGIKQPTLSDIVNGFTQRSRYLPEIASVLGIDLSTVTPKGSRRNAVDISRSSVEGRPGRDFPVYFMRHAQSGEGYVLTEAMEFVERPALLATVQSSFGICVAGDAMVPAYEPGDIVFVHPYQPPVPGSDVVLRPDNEDDSRVQIGRLVSETATEWRILQHNGKKNITLSKGTWGRCDRIVGKYNRR